jgi:hypothetical protein
MKLPFVKMLALGGVSLFTLSVTQAQITWVSNGTFTSDSVLTLAGTTANEVYGVDFGGSGTQTTANGYTFADYGNGNMSIAGGGYGLYNNYLGGGGATSDTGFNNILNYGLYGSSANTGTLNNLTVGQTYYVLAILADTRGAPTAGAEFYATDGISDSPDQQEAFTGGSPALGGYSLGTFVATATAQAYSLVTQTTQGNFGNSQYNAILLETVPEPTTLALMGGGALTLLMALRRKK